MFDKLQKAVEFMAQYPPWVVVCSFLLMASSLLLLVLFKPREEQKPKPETTDSSLAILTASYGSPLQTPSDARVISSVWRGPLDHIVDAKKSDLLESAQKFSILHIEAAVLDHSIQFTDGPLAASQLRDILALDTTTVDLVVLSACSSFRIGKALENTKVEYSLVALDNLSVDLGAAFYEEFYRHYAAGSTIELAYERAVVRRNTQFDRDTKEVIMLTRYHEAK